MLGKRILLLCLMLSHQVVEAQLEASNWVFGGFGGVNFSCSVPQIFPTPFDGLEGGASISSASGELLFFTDGDAVWTKDLRIMPNGRDIGGLCTAYFHNSSSSQSSLIVPHPGNSDLYYLFTTDCAEDYFAAGLRYSIIDMSLNGGMGDVTEKNKPLVNPSAEKIAAVFQPNGTDVWVVTHGIYSNTFYAYSITGAGLNPVPVISNTGQIHPGGRGYLKFSPDGHRLAAACFKDESSDGINTEIFDFDLNSGVVTSNFILPSLSKSDYAVSFSPNGKILYTSCSWACSLPTIEQFNLEAGTPQQIVDQRYIIQVPRIFGGLQLGIDGKLYYMSYDTNTAISYLSVIQSPNTVGPASNLVRNHVALFCWTEPAWGLPNYIESYFLSPATTTCQPVKKDLIENFGFTPVVDCEGLRVAIDNESSARNMELKTRGSTEVRITWQFDFGDGTLVDSADPQDLNHTYASPGTYTLTLTVWHFFCVLRQTKKVIEIFPVQSKFQALQECESLHTNFVNTTVDLNRPVQWNWNFGDNSPTSSEKNPTHTYSNPGTYTVTLTATSSCNSSSVASVVEVHEPFIISLGDDTTYCLGQPLTLSTDRPADSYQWSTGEVSPAISISTPGVYWVEARLGNCTGADTVNVSYPGCHVCNPYLQALNVGSDTTLCETDAVKLIVPNAILGDVLWSTGTTERSLDVTDPGRYWVTVSYGDCEASDTLTVATHDCSLCEALIPNIISPNGDGKNDQFSFSADCDYHSFRMEIYNRWGNKMLTTSSPVWNGFIGNEIAFGIYYFTLQYSYTGAQSRVLTQHRKGWIQVVK